MRTLVLITVFLPCLILGNPARESYQRTKDILAIVEKIEELLQKEDRLREITDIIRMDSNIDKMSKTLDRLVLLVEGGRSPPYGRSTSAMAPYDGDVPGRLDGMDERLTKLEESMDKIEGILASSGIDKLNELDQRSLQMKDDMSNKMKKMMNIITSLYEMNKDIKTNLGGRIDAMTPSSTASPEDSRRSQYASEFMVQSLEDLEKKIKEEFSVLANEIRTEITGLKIVASSVGCDNGNNDDYEFQLTPGSPDGSRGHQSRSAASSSRDGPRTSRDSRINNTLDNLVQTLSRTTREIKEEIHQGMQNIDEKLANLTNLPSRCEDPLEAAGSQIQTSKLPRSYDLSPEQSLDEKDLGKKDSCSKTAKDVSSPKSCAELRKGGATCDGVYIVFLQGLRAVRVWCDMTTEGGGWTVLMRRGDYGDKMTTFHKNWLSYKNGFGDTEGEFWLGNDAFHLLTHQEDNILRVHLESFDDDDLNLTYSNFKIANEAHKYKMTLGPSVGRSTAASNGLQYHNNHPFSTFDKKNDPFHQNCAATYKGGWWFNGCYFGFLTGEYFGAEDKRESWQGILWYDWKGTKSLKAASMMIRPKNFAT